MHTLFLLHVCLFGLILYILLTIFQLGAFLPGLNQYLARINVATLLSSLIARRWAGLQTL